MLQLRLGACLRVALQHGGEIGRQLMGVMPDHVQIIAVLVIPRMATFDAVDLRLQCRLLGCIVGL